MLSFDLSAFDIVLAIAVVTLILLFLAQKHNNSTAKSKLPPSDQQKLAEKLDVPVKAAYKEVSVERSSTDFETCIHSFGHLRNHPENTPVPEECFGCPRILDCLFPK